VDRLFLDANVLFTAVHRPQGKAAFLFQALDIGIDEPVWQLLSSAYAIEEARRNLVAKFAAAAGSLDSLLTLVQVVAQPPVPSLALALPAKDMPIWAAAHGARSTHLLTGDLRDFGPYMNRPEATGGVVIQTVAEYLAARARSH
jgi:hypothetical protein